MTRSVTGEAGAHLRVLDGGEHGGTSHWPGERMAAFAAASAIQVTFLWVPLPHRTGQLPAFLKKSAL